MTPEQLERRIFEQWEAEEITLMQFVQLLQAHGWSRAEIYDWLCSAKGSGNRRPLTSHLKGMVKR